MSYTFALSTSHTPCSLRSANSSRSNSITSTSSTSSSIYSHSPSTSSLPPLARLPTRSPEHKKPKVSFFHHSTSSSRHQAPPTTIPSIVDTKKEAREAREARNRAIRLREQLLREPNLEDDESTPSERRDARNEGDKWKMHYGMMAGTPEMMDAARSLRR